MALISFTVALSRANTSVEIEIHTVLSVSL